jgi:rubrerythrin
MATREKEAELVEKAVGELFTDIGTEITYIKKRIEELTVESAASQPIWPADSVTSVIPSGEKSGGAQTSEILASSAPQGAESQKKCPMCGGRMIFYGKDKKWMCYTCAYEELTKEKVGEQESEIREASAPQDTEFQKKCPMCAGRMNFHINERMWLCYTCAYEELEKDGAQGEDEQNSELANEPEQTSASAPKPDPPPPFAVPLASMISNESQKTKKGATSRPSGKKKTCPVCHKKMDWYDMEKAWQCRFCGYERSI